MVENSETPAKVHPATREMLPDDPLELTSFEVTGDSDLMLRLLVEEYARIGWDLEAIMRLARDPFYLGLHGLLQRHGEVEMRRRVAEILSRSGVTRVKMVETESAPIQLVQLELPQ
jgi:hypothetical protein